MAGQWRTDPQDLRLLMPRRAWPARSYLWKNRAAAEAAHDEAWREGVRRR